jgi:uracil-DNA glycosylase
MDPRSAGVSCFPFGRVSTRRPPRVPPGPAELLVLGVYPSALHVRWTLPDKRITVGALAVDDEPTVFWDGANAAERIVEWRAAVRWVDEWGSVSHAGGNGSSGRHVVEHVLKPLGVAPSTVYFTDCLPFFFVKDGAGSQAERIRAIYQPFAKRMGLPLADLPPRPGTRELVERSLEHESDVLLGQLNDAQAPRVLTLGQEATDVFARLAGAERVVLRPEADYGRPRSVRVAGAWREWIPLTHPGNRTSIWAHRHQAWREANG